MFFFKKNSFKNELKSQGIPYKKSAFINAVQNKNVKVIELFLNAGMSPDVKLKSEPALHISVQNNSMDIVKLFLQHNVDVNKTGLYDHHTALSIASEYGLYDIARLLLENGASGTPYILVLAAEKGYLEIVKLLVEHGVNTALPDWSGKYPLVEGMAHIPVIQYLLENGADPNIQESPRISLLEYSCKWGYIDQVKLFLKHGVDVNGNRESYRSPLLHAIDRATNREEKKEIVKLLLEHGADINEYSPLGEIPFINAALIIPEPEFMELFINKGADVNIHDKDGYTPLHMAARGNNTDKVKLLLSKGAKIDSENNQGRTPLFEAVAGNARRKIEVIKLLLQHGADINCKDSTTGDTVISIAEKLNDNELIKILKKA